MNIAIFGYGNIGKGVECAVPLNPDMKLVGIFTRRDPGKVRPVMGTPCFSADRLPEFKDSIDALIICAGSATDLPSLTPALAAQFNVVDSFDTHKRIPEHFKNTDTAASENGHIAVICGGWDPGMFSIMRLYSQAILPEGRTYTFWGKGVSQGHSEAVRRMDGVEDAIQYTIPKTDALDLVRSGRQPELDAGSMHEREVFVALKPGADKDKIESDIKSMPNYFSDYDTTVHFISKEQLKAEHSGMPHGGFVIRNGKTGPEGRSKLTHTIEYSLELGSNPEFTANILVALARAAVRAANRGESGCRTIFDFAPAELSPLSAEELRQTLL